MAEYEEKMLTLRQGLPQGGTQQGVDPEADIDEEPGLTDLDIEPDVDVPAQTETALKKHANVPFVDRILNAPKYPSRPNYDKQGNLVSRSTHLMSRAGGGPGERAFVYPTLQLIEGKWVENPDPTDALKRGNVVYFDSVKEADRFAEGSWKPFAGKTRDDI